MKQMKAKGGRIDRDALSTLQSGAQVAEDVTKEAGLLLAARYM